MTETSIYQIVRNEWESFQDDLIEIVPGYSFNQIDTIKRCHLYYNSKFEDNSSYCGRERLFFNIVKYRKEVATRFLNFDTKDIRLWPLNPQSEISTFLLEKELQLWLKQNGVAKLLNQIADEAPLYGSAVIRKLKKGAKCVDLRRLALDPTVDNIEQSRFVTIKHFLTASELRKKIKDGWDEKAVETLIASKGTLSSPASYDDETVLNTNKSTPYFEVMERYGEVPEWIYEGKGTSDKLIRTFYIVGNVDKYSRGENGAITAEQGLTLFKSKWNKEWPFKDFHYSKTRGRWLGRGVIEDLFEAQERENELANQKRVSMELSSMHVFQTTGSTVLQNILQDLENGDVIVNQGNPLTPLPNEERNLPAFNTEFELYDTLADRLSFAHEAVRGEAMSSSTPATNAVIQTQGAQSIFAFKKENLGIMLRDFFNEMVLPELLDNLSAEHVLVFTGTSDDLNKLDTIIVKPLIRREVMDRILKGQAVTQEQAKSIEQKYLNDLKKRGGRRFLNLKKDFYKDVDIEFDFMTTNEQEDVATIANNYFNVLQTLAKNPETLKNPMIRTIFYQWAQRVGVSPAKLELAELKEAENAPQQTQPQQMPQMPQQAQQTQQAQLQQLMTQ